MVRSRASWLPKVGVPGSPQSTTEGGWRERESRGGGGGEVKREGRRISGGGEGMKED